MTSVGVDAATRRGKACSAEDATYTYPRDMAGRGILQFETR